MRVRIHLVVWVVRASSGMLLVVGVYGHFFFLVCFYGYVFFCCFISFSFFALFFVGVLCAVLRELLDCLVGRCSLFFGSCLWPLINASHFTRKNIHLKHIFSTYRMDN